MTRAALILGGGVAAACCAEALCCKGWRVTVRAPVPAHAPTLVLNPITVDLIATIFDHAPGIFADAHRLRRGAVCWGTPAPDFDGETPALVISGEVFAERLLALLQERHGGRAFEFVRADADAAETEGTETRDAWRVYAGGARGADAEGLRPAEFRRYGRRQALLATARLKDSADADTYWIESAPPGWLFLAPCGSGRALLQAVLPGRIDDPDEALLRALSGTRWVGGLVAEVVGRARVFASAPGRLKTVCGSNWLAAGSLACAYDPLCGDGTGYAVREAILASAVLDGIERGLPREACLEHYRARLARAFHAHLRACSSFYATGGFSDEWDEEMNALAGGLREVEREVAAHDEFRYGLRGLDLIPFEGV